jgi:cytoskeleton protein RodZ
MDQPRTQEGNQTTAKDGFGVHLRREREMRGVTLEEISSATRIGTRFLDALETEHWDRLPGGVFNRGFVRSTAQFLGLDPEAMLAEYTIATTDSARPAAPVLIHSQSSWTPKTANASRDRRWVPGVVLVAIAAVGVGGWFGWRHLRDVRRARADAAALAAASGATTTTSAAGDNTSPAPDTNSPAATATPDTPDATSQPAQVDASQPATSDSSSAPVSSTSAPASAPDGASDVAADSPETTAPAASATAATGTSATAAIAPPSASRQLTLKIEVGRATSVKVSIDGHKSFQGKIPAGGSRIFHANDVFFVTAHDAGGVLLELNGQTLPPLGPPGHSANIRLTRESLKSQDGTNH